MVLKAINKQAWKCHSYYGGDIVKHNDTQKDSRTFLGNISIQRLQSMSERET